MRVHRSSLLLQFRRGGVTPLAALSLAMLVGVVAVVVDGGSLLEERRHVQAAADAAALAGAADLFANYPANKGADPAGTASTSALANASANGFSNDGVQSVVTVNVTGQNYQEGPNAGQAIPAGYVEVIIQYNAGRTFSGIFGSGTVPVRAHAVARGQWTSINNSVVLLNLTGSSALTLSGGAGLNINGGLQVNSSSPNALSLFGGAGVSASSINLNQAAGKLLGSLLSFLLDSGGSQPSVNYGGPTPDPLRYLPAPDPVQLGLTTQGTNLQISGRSAVNLYPGVYTGGITVSQRATVTLHANSDGTPGIYYLQGGGFQASGSSSITTAANETAGVMIYNAWQANGDAISLAGSGSLTLTPPASGTYQGISIFQARGTLANPAPALSITGGASTYVSGTIYAAYANVSLTGNASGNVIGGQIIADTLTLSGQAVININRGTQPVANTRLFGLVQ